MISPKLQGIRGAKVEAAGEREGKREGRGRSGGTGVQTLFWKLFQKLGLVTLYAEDV